MKTCPICQGNYIIPGTADNCRICDHTGTIPLPDSASPKEVWKFMFSRAREFAAIAGRAAIRQRQIEECFLGPLPELEPYHGPKNITSTQFRGPGIQYFMPGPLDPLP